MYWIQLIESKIGHNAYIEAYKTVSEQIIRIRTDRKRKRAVEKIVDPVAAAERKRRKNLGKKASKKRKIAEYRLKGGRIPNKNRRISSDI